MVLLAHIHERFHLSRETYGSPDLADYRNVVQDQRYLELHDEIADLDSMIGAIVDELAPSLVARNSIGHGAAAQLLLTAGDNVQRLQSEAGFAALCGVSPVPASPLAGFGRSANQGLHGETYRRGHSKLEIIRCLKRYIDCEVFTHQRNMQHWLIEAMNVPIHLLVQRRGPDLTRQEGDEVSSST
jgi:hypothetical protein